MNKSTLKQVKKSVRNHNRSVNRANKIFDNLSPSEKRVSIARDVLVQLALGKLKATFGIWLEDSNSDTNSLLTENQKLRYKNKELKEILDKKKQCNGCAIGGMFMCAVKRADKLKICQLRDFNAENEYGGSDLGVFQEEMFDYLSKFFSKKQLEMIETAFEQGGGGTNSDDGSENFAEEVEEPSERMRLIMENIVVNKGTFCPNREPVAVYTTKGFVG